MPKKSAGFLKKETQVTGLAARASRPPLVRMIKIHEFLAAEKYPNCSKLARDLEVSTKTLQRDIDFMRDQLMLPIEYDAVQHGFYYAESVAQFPMVTVSQGELVALLVAQKAVEQYRGTSFEKPLHAAFEKLVSSMDDQTSVSMHELSAAVSFRSQGVPHAQIRVFETLTEAVMHHQVVEFDYLSMKAKRPERRRVEPYHLACIDNQWYLICNDLVREGRRTFALPRIENVKTLRQIFEKSPDFSVADMLSGSFSAFEAGKTETIRLHFQAAVARLVSERQWHKTQKLHAKANGDVELEMKVGLAPDLEAWILGWGGQVEVLEPASLREKIAAIGKEISTKNA